MAPPLTKKPFQARIPRVLLDQFTHLCTSRWLSDSSRVFRLLVTHNQLEPWKLGAGVPLPDISQYPRAAFEVEYAQAVSIEEASLNSCSAKPKRITPGRLDRIGRDLLTPEWKARLEPAHKASIREQAWESRTSGSEIARRYMLEACRCSVDSHGVLLAQQSQWESLSQLAKRLTPTIEAEEFLPPRIRQMKGPGSA